MRTSRTLLGSLAVLALVLTACGGSDDDAADVSTPDPTEPEATDAPPSTDSTEPTEPGPTTSIELTATAPGVTADTITIGYSWLDVDGLREAGVVDINHGPYEEQFQILVDAVNDEGGVHGRRLEFVGAGYLPIGNESQQQVCLELTEDHEVFAVLGTMRDDNVLCVTEQHDTAAVLEFGMTTERLERSTAPYATSEASIERKLEELVVRGADAGLLDGRTVAVHATLPADHYLATEVIVPALEAADVDVVFTSLLDTGDVDAATTAMQINVERMRSLDVDLVVIVGDALIPSSTFVADDFLPTLLLGDLGSGRSLPTSGIDPSVFPRVVTIGGEPEDEDEPEGLEDVEPGLRRCFELWNAAHPDDPVGFEVDVGGPEYNIGIGAGCTTLAIFVAAADAAGPVLTNETFLAGLESLGDFDLPGHTAASFGPGKYDGADDLGLRGWDASLGDTGDFGPFES